MNRTILGSLIGAALLAMPASAQKPRDIVDTAVSAGSFKTLVAAVKAADLAGALKSKGPFTVFAPTDSAFAKLPDGAVASLLEKENLGQLQAILKFHVAPGRLTAADVVSRDAVDTLNGQRAAVRVRNGAATIGGAKIVKTDIACSNGIIHVIDGVIMPSGDDIVKVARKAGDFDTLWAAAKAAGLAETIAGNGPFTVLAPTDAAFAKVPQKTLRSLLQRENRDQLVRILKYHVVPGRVFADQAVTAGTAKTLAGAELQFRIRNGRLAVNDSNITGTDVQAANGVIHVIDTVLMPPAPAKPKGRKYFGLRFEQPSAALAAQLGLDRHQSLVVTSVVGGSQAAAAGLQKYDLITSVGGRPASDANITRAKNEGDYGEKIRFQIVRRGKQKHLNIAIGEEK